MKRLLTILAANP